MDDNDDEREETLILFRLRGQTSAGPGEDSGGREVRLRGLAVAGAGEGEHLAGAVHQEQVWRRPHLRPARPHGRSLPARLPGLPAGGAGGVRHLRAKRVHVHQGAEGERGHR